MSQKERQSGKHSNTTTASDEISRAILTAIMFSYSRLQGLQSLSIPCPACWVRAANLFSRDCGPINSPARADTSICLLQLDGFTLTLQRPTKNPSTQKRGSSLSTDLRARFQAPGQVTSWMLLGAEKHLPPPLNVASSIGKRRSLLSRALQLILVS